MSVDPNRQIARTLLHWYRQNARTLPWRMPPGSNATPDPYRVWLAEVMLQQTTVAAAIPRYLRFLDRFPDISALANACVEDVLSEWAGLGYYARARNLHACAQTIAEKGAFPRSEVELRALPGVGDYTAAAVAAFAFGQQTVPMDANLLRVGARLFAVDQQPERARKTVRSLLSVLVPADAPGDFAQALMDIGAGVCLPRNPRCLACPLSRHCAAHAMGTPGAFPLPKQRPERPHRHGTLWWLESRGQVALVRRPAKGLLGGLLAFPGSAWTEGANTLQLPPGVFAAASGMTVRHGFTHFTLELEIMAARLATPIDRLGTQTLIWIQRDALLDAGLPSLYRKAAVAMLASPAASCFEAA